MTDDVLVLLTAMKRIARGHADGGRPLAGDVAREIAREALNQCHVSWAWRDVMDRLGEAR